MVLTGYSILLTFAWVAMGGYLIFSARKVKFLKDISPLPGLPGPTVAIIIAVRNEEAELETALNSVLHLDYRPVKIIVINDRSTDRTPEILSKMVWENPALLVITVTELPRGWLGKNHALYQGYLASSEEYLLFTDADVIFNRQALTKAMNYVVTGQIDHLAVLPEITSPSVLFRSVMNTFTIMLEMRQRPWDIPNPKSDASIGVGAFNLVKRTAYEKTGTHTAFSLRPDDDLKLGERVKAAGLRQDVVYGNFEISLAWYTSLAQFISGLMKNTFSISNYHWPTAMAMAMATLFVFVLPIPLALFAEPYGPVLALVILAAQILIMIFKRGTSGIWWHALLIPFAGTIVVYIIVKSAYKTIRQGGIYWRDTFYPLSELKQQK
jgi:glycosyltransferase involved in cell wall biosynthesis